MNKTVLITGASTGIGYELSKVFSKNGYDLVLVSRNSQKLEVIAKEMEKQHDIKAKVIPKDLSKSSAPQELHNDIVADGIATSTCLSTMQDLELMVNSLTLAQIKNLN